jgi:hypothetical protein
VKKTAPAILPCMLDLAADRFVGPDVDETIITLRRLQQVMLTRLRGGELVPDELRQRDGL